MISLLIELLLFTNLYSLMLPMILNVFVTTHSALYFIGLINSTPLFLDR